MNYLAVCSNLLWVYQDSHNLKGYPAIHAISSDEPSKTLCGKNPDNWSFLGLEQSDIRCKTCLKIMAKRMAQ